MQTVISEARAIVNATPSTLGPFSLITLESVFGGITESYALPAFCERQYSAGQYMSQRGEVPDRIFVVVHAIAMLDDSDPATAGYSARAIMPGELIGLVEGLAGRPLRHDVIASTDCKVRAMVLDDLILHLADHPVDRSRVIGLLADFVRNADRYLRGI